MQDFINSLAPYLTAFSVILGVGTLGFIINLA
ncbi:MAG: hypothetical protein QOG38_230, partial [Hyphomicrobiales bacterium]|nr:hypothetical protein [Hyphomicrobiales bacterium]